MVRSHRIPPRIIGHAPAIGEAPVNRHVFGWGDNAFSLLGHLG
jgi:hypothetical protein